MTKNRLSIKAYYILIFLFLFPGLIVSVNKILIRSLIESKSKLVEVAVDFNEYNLLARTDGWTIDKLFTHLTEAGATSIAFTEDTLESLEFEGKIKIIPLDHLKKYTTIIPEDYIKHLPQIFPTGIFVYSDDTNLINRIERNLIYKSLCDKYIRVAGNCIFIAKFDTDFITKTGLGFDEEKINLAIKHNLSPIIRVINYPNLKVENIRALVRSLPPAASTSTIIFADFEILGNRGALHEAVTALYERGYRIGYVEFHDQEGMQELISFYKMRKPLVRVHSISRKELDEIYTPQRAIARFIRAIRERGIKLIYVRCFLQHPKLYIPHMIQYNLDYLKDLIAKIKYWNFDLVAFKQTNIFDVYFEPKYSINKLTYFEKLAIYLAAIFFTILLYSYTTGKILSTKLIIGIIIISTITTYIVNDIYTKTFHSLLLAILTPILAILKIYFYNKETKITYYTSITNISLLNSLQLLIFSLIAGIIITGMYAEPQYLLYFEKFRGIKIALALPIIFNLIYITNKLNINIFSIINKKLTIKDVLVVLLVIVGTGLYVLRSGNISYLKPNAFEDRIRTFLEETLIARPRNKEFIIGYPSLFILNFMIYKSFYSFIPIIIVFSTMTSTSIINTFCHFHMPINLAFIRTFNGFWLGIILGQIILFLALILTILSAVCNKQNKIFLVGYFGFGNTGDEILWREFIKFCQNDLPDYKWVVLHKTGTDNHIPLNTTLVARSNIIQVLSEIALSKFIIIPGGGVIQSKTSLRSLIYYFSILLLSKLLFCKILLPAQGIGPLLATNRTKLHHQISQMICRFILEIASYFSVRDEFSLKEISEIYAPPVSCKIAADLVFAIDKISLTQNFGTQNTDLKNKDKVKIGVVLKNVEKVQNLVRLLNTLIKEYENIEIIPIIFQPQFDEPAWKDFEKFLPINISNPAIEEIYKLVSNYDIIISMRLHGCILATIFEIPWIAINIDPKIESFAKMINWPYIYDLEKLSNYEIIADMLNSIIANLSQIRSNLSTTYYHLHAIAKEELKECINIMKK